MNFVLFDQAPVDARLRPSVFAPISASVLVVVIAVLGGNLAVPSSAPLRLWSRRVCWAPSQDWRCCRRAMLSLAGVLNAPYPATTAAFALVVLKKRVTFVDVVNCLRA